MSQRTDYDRVAHLYDAQPYREKEPDAELALFAEVHRVLDRGGLFVLQNICPEKMEQAALYRFFPEARERDQQDFLPLGAHEALLREVGFAHVDVAVERKTFKTPREYFAATVQRRENNSQLMSVSDDAYARGLERVAAAEGELADEVALLTVRADKSA